jgi:hypothetical protein
VKSGSSFRPALLLTVYGTHGLHDPVEHSPKQNQKVKKSKTGRKRAGKEKGRSGSMNPLAPFNFGSTVDRLWIDYKPTTDQ